jgi:PHD/YefM family antitoxin component YafN of YafNO toxin-antitoxin module
MFDLNKIIDLIKETGREIFLAKENKETLVIMSVDRYRELIKKDNSVNSSTIDSAGDIKEKDYPDYVQKTIMPDIDR